MDSVILKYFSAFIEKELGIIYSEANYFQLQNRLEEIARSYSFTNVNELYEISKVKVPENLRQDLLDLATNNETSFFRDVKVFQGLKHLFSNSIKDNTFGTNLKIWSAACSTGQEVVSLSIILNELKEQMKEKFNFTIHGSDISKRALARAMKGQYSSFELSRGLSEEYRNKYFESLGENLWQASPSIMKTLSFEKRNLITPFHFSDLYHFIFCRNVLIYQKVESKIEILKKLTNCLQVGGYLVLGSGESLFGLSNNFEQVNVEGAIFYRKLP